MILRVIMLLIYLAVSLAAYSQTGVFAEVYISLLLTDFVLRYKSDK